MNTTLMNLNPANTVQTPPASGKQHDDSAPDAVFSQVLSSELAQNRKGGEAAKDSESQADSATVSQPAADADAARIIKLKEFKKSLHDPLAKPLTDSMPGLPALAIHLDMFKPITPGIDDPQVRQTADVNGNAPISLNAVSQDTNKERTAPALTTGKLPDNTPDSRAGKPVSADTADFKMASTAAAPNATASMFSEQITAARRADALSTLESMPDIANQPVAAATSQALLSSVSVINSVASTKLTPSVGSDAWGPALGEKIVWMAADGRQTASLTLNPPDMGPLQIILNVTNDQATASFFSAQPEVRHALESALPKLREMMGDAGIQLGQATVSADTPRQNSTPERQMPVPPYPGADHAVMAGLQSAQHPVRQSGIGLVDTYA